MEAPRMEGSEYRGRRVWSSQGGKIIVIPSFATIIHFSALVILARERYGSVIKAPSFSDCVA